ncbi:serine/threonine-protein kinase [Nocardioides sp.]|uniref:serine/threonine-protein kinase n=1 Tax=Nocardioides sp. TaxID=35761 RepID=UPI00262A5F7F|nr:serine/threonine-protein kinase [Nocardioides sp.]
MEAPEVIAGRYRVERAIGRGGMGTVWLCTDEVLGREVAVKQVGLLPGESAPDLARALREARSSAALNHPNVVSVFDAVEDEQGRSWLVMEHVDGSTLSQLVEREGRLEPRRVAAIGAQVAGGLAAAHARGTVHRDVKPSNVLVDGDTAKISDFGIARTEGDAALTRSGLLIGTPLYFSPELARGEEPTPAADVWALGATLYAAVEGRLPVEDRGNPIATLAAIASASVPRPEQAGPLTPVLARMLDPDPGARCTMAEAAAELARLADEHPTQMLETPVTATAPLAAAASVPSAPVDPEPTPGTESTPVVAAPPAAPSAERSRRRTPVLVVALLLLLLGGAVAVALLPGEDEEPAAAPDGPSSTAPQDPRPSGTSEPSEEPLEEPSQEAEDAEPSEEAATTAPAAEAEAGSGEAEALVSEYYGLLPDDTRTAWGYLGGEARSDAGGYGGYTGFWETVESVSVEGTSVEDGVVTVDLVYDGAESETRRLAVGEQGGGLVILDDLGPA